MSDASGMVPLGPLIEGLLACLDEPGVSEQTLVRIVPEFGIDHDGLYASGSAVSHTNDERPPAVVIEYRRPRSFGDQKPG